MKILAKSIIEYVQSRKAARKERLERQAAADAYALVTSYRQGSSLR